MGLIKRDNKYFQKGLIIRDGGSTTIYIRR